MTTTSNPWLNISFTKICTYPVCDVDIKPGQITTRGFTAFESSGAVAHDRLNWPPSGVRTVSLHRKLMTLLNK